MRRPELRDEDGMTLTELMVGALIGVVLCLGLFSFLDNTSKSSERTAARVDAAKLGRPVMAGILDRLHSACVAPGVAPVLEGSTSTSMAFLSRTGSTVSVTPEKHVITLQSGALVERIFSVSSGTAPSWTFSSTPIAPPVRTLLSPAAQATTGTPPVNVAVFRYYAFQTDGQLSAAPLSVPLSAADAAKTVQVTVSFAVPPRNDETDLDGDGGPDGVPTFTDTAQFRFSPPGESVSAENLPCT